MKFKQFDYYIFIDFSENLIGYSIIKDEKLNELLPKISKFAHYKNLRNKKLYLKSMKSRIEKEKILSYFLKYKIKELYKNTDIYADVLEFIKKNENCIIFISIDNRQYKAFNKLVGFVDGKKVVVKKESELVKGTPEYQTSLVLDTLLNIERNKQ
jgi:replicative superfamily II helicase